MSETSCDVIVIGAGAAGLMAAIMASERKRRVVLIEKNRKVGVKILISGGTRCNLTHDTDAKGIIEAFGKNGRFLHSALSQYSPSDVLDFFHGEGVPTKREPNGKIFPASDKALHVQQALLNRLLQTDCQLANQQAVQSIEKVAAGFQVVTDKESFTSQSVIVATGGLSYAGCGTTGDGYHWLQSLGHTITPRFPALVPVCIQQQWVKDLSGISLVDCQLSVVPAQYLDTATDLDGVMATIRKRQIMQRRAPLLFTHHGLSGPAAMDISKVISSAEEPENLRVVLDLIPDESHQEKLQQLQQAIQSSGNRVLVRWLNQVALNNIDVAERLLDSVLKSYGIDSGKKLAELTKSERPKSIECLKAIPMTPTGTLGYPKAEVTTGGVNLKEVNPKTMESRICPGLFIAGEVLDLDGHIGGFNFQSAFSTGWVAGHNA